MFFTFALWVGKLPTSRRYNRLPLLRSSPGGFARSWPYRTYPYTCIYSNVFTGTHACVSIALAKLVHFFHLSKHKDKIISRLPRHDQQKHAAFIAKTRHFDMKNSTLIAFLKKYYTFIRNNTFFLYLRKPSCNTYY